MPVAAVLVAAVACGEPPPNPLTLLAQARAAVDATPAAHFELSSSNVSGAGPLITGGSGDARRPDGLRGSLTVEVGGLALPITVVSAGGSFYVKLPTDRGFTRTDPAEYGFGDPAQFLDPERGLSSLLAKCSSVRLQADDRSQGELLHEVTCRLPGQDVAALLTSADPGRPVEARFGIAADSHQLRRVVLRGPFFSATTLSTFTAVLDRYGENVTVTAPAAP